MYSHINSKEYPISVVNEFDSLKEQRRKLFDISEIDGLLSFENRKNLYIVSNGEFYCLNNRGIFYSKDSGASWIRLNIQWPEEYNLQHPWTITIKE